MQCLILDNKEVKAAVDELTTVLGSKDAAYYVVSENNGHAIDQAPNGEPSKLFSDLLSHYNGNREQAIKAKVKVFTDEFKNWFGDWINNVEGSSKIVDENGEPLIVYHGTNEDNINIFDRSQQTGNTLKGTGTATLGNFFTDNVQKANEFANAVTFRRKTGSPTSYSVFLNIKNPINFQTLHEFRQWSKEEGYYDEDGDFISTKTIPQGNDGILVETTNQLDTSKEFVAINSNQIKSVDNQGSFSTQDDSIFKAESVFEYDPNIGLDYTLQKIFHEDAVTTVSNALQQLQFYYAGSRFDNLYNLFKDSNILIELSANTQYMDYSLTNNTIRINPATFSMQSTDRNIRTLMHEIVHAYTVSSIYRVKQGKNFSQQEKYVYDTINKLYKKVLLIEGPKKETGDYYGLKNIYEFTSELLTNQSFVENIINDMANKNEVNSIKDLLQKIWRSIVNLLTKQYNQQDIEVIQGELLDLISFNVDNNIPYQYFFDNTNDLVSRQQQAIFNMESQLDQIEQDKEQFEKITHNLAQSINEALQSRLKIFKHPDPIVEQQAKKTMEWQIQNITQGLVSDYESISNFLQQSADEIKTASEMLIKARKNNEIIDDTKLNDLDQNFFSFYVGIIDDIVQQLIYREPYREIVGKDGNGNYKLDRLIKRAKSYQALLTEGQLIVKSQIARNASKILKDVGVDVGAVTIYRYEQTDITSYDKDISYLTYLFGAGDKIKDDCIKSIFYLINGAEEKVRKDTYAKQNQLVELLQKTNKYNQLQLFEVDDDGNTTGYFVRSRNYGKFEKAYKKEMDNICMQLGIDITDLNLPENRAIRIEYNKLRNKWLSEHCERRFTAEYYEAFNHLSNETQQQRESIQIDIRNLQNKVRDNYGIVRLERLNPQERAQLKKHQLEKKQLASIYDINGRKKQGIQLQVAEELQELNKKLSEGIVLTKNSAAYEKEKARVMSDKTLTQAQKDEWLELNSKVQYKEKFYQMLDKAAKKYYGEEYAALQERRRAILSMFREDSTGEIDANNLPQGTKNALSAISRRMTQIRKQKKASTIPGEYEFDKIAKTVPTKQWYEDKRKFYDSLLNDDPESAQLWLQANAYTIKSTDSNGRVSIKTVPKSWYTKLVPKDESLIERVPNNNWLEVSKDSPFYNEAYYRAQVDHPELKDEYWIPKEDKYDSSDRYNKIQNNPEVKALYDALLQTMAEANAEYTNLSKIYPYRTPQISGSLYRYIGAEWRASKGLYKLSAPFKGFSEWFKDKLSVRNDDKGFNKALNKPNGERLNLIPQNYIARLDNPAVLKADAVGSVIEYYRSAKEWKYKKDIQPKVELLKSHILGKKYLDRSGQVKTDETNVAKFAKAFIDMNLYDIKSQTVTISYGNNKSGKLFGIVPYKGSIFNLINYDISKPREINITKMLAILRTLGTARNLALNLWCALTGGFTALYSHIVNSLVQRYYNPVDASYAFKDMISDLIVNVPNKLGITSYTPFMTKCMEYFEVGATMQLNPTNRNKLLNMTSKHWGFGIYTLQDHFVKGQILGSIMHNYKLVIDENGNRQFMSREAYKQKYGLKVFKPGDVLDWNFGDKLTFRDAIQFIGGEMVAKDPANQSAVDAVKNEIGYLARQLSQSADGQLTDLQRSVILAKAAGQFVMMHRQYLPVILQERFLMSRQLDYQTRRYKEAVFQTPYRIFTQAIEHNENILLAFRREFLSDPVVRENIAKITTEISLWLLITQLLRPLISSSADDDKKNKLKQLFAYVTERTSFEIMAPYNIFDIARTVKSPSAIISYIENATEVMSAPANMLFNTTRSLFKEESFDSNKVIKRGAYKGMTEFERALWKLTPFKNLWELKDIQSKRNYYQKQILGE